MNRALIRLITVIFFIGISGSCKDKKQEMLLRETSMRLEQQNAGTKNSNQMLRNNLYRMMYGDCSRERIGYLEKDAEIFYQRANHFLEEIKTAKELTIKMDVDKLYENYSAFQIFYHQLKNRIEDSFKYTRLDTNINGFMNLDKKRFVQKYFAATDSEELKIHLQLLESDALINESAFLLNIINLLTPSWNFDPMITIATSDYLTYKKGDKLKIKSFIAQYVKCFKGYAIIDGQKIESKDGFFNYSRIIKESTGIYKVPIKIVYLSSGNRQEAYPAEVTFKVE